VINGTVDEACSGNTLVFVRANSSELRSIVWEEPIYIPSEPRSSYSSGASSLERGGPGVNGGGANGLVSATASILSMGYAIPYLLFFLGVVFVILLALKRRPDPSTKNLQV